MITAFFTRNVIVAETEINYFQRLVLWVNQNIEWFNISMHDSLRVQVMKTLSWKNSVL